MARPTKGEQARTTPMTVKVSVGQKQIIRDFCKAFGSGVFIGIVMTAIREYAEAHREEQDA